MAYRCLACSHIGSRFPGGACPGCGSFHIQKIKTEEPKPVARKSYRLMLAVVLWAWLMWELYRQLRP